MLYLDTNVFVYAAVNTEELGEKSGALLLKIQQGEEKAVTSVLTMDEVFWSIKKHDRTAAFEACQALLNFPNIEIIPATKELALSALQIIKECRLDPRDAIHAATAIAEKVDCIVSADAHFDRVKGLKRRPL
jgi:predicted nucleic acid-binding protein